MTYYSDAELRELRLIDQLVRAELKRQGLSMVNDKSFDELIVSGELKAAECHVLSRNMVDPNWYDRALADGNDTP